MSFAEYNVFRHGHKDKGCTTPRKEMSDVQIDIDTWVFIYRALRRFNSSSSYVDRRRLNFTIQAFASSSDQAIPFHRFKPFSKNRYSVSLLLAKTVLYRNGWT